MLSISDFARLGQVSPRMLRHYDDLGLLRPGRVDGVTGYRSYGTAQLTRLHKLLALRDLGFTLEQIVNSCGTVRDRHPGRRRHGARPHRRPTAGAGCVPGPRSPIENVQPVYAAFLRWIEAAGYRLAAGSRELYHDYDPSDPVAGITELQIPITR